MLVGFAVIGVTILADWSALSTPPTQLSTSPHGLPGLPDDCFLVGVNYPYYHYGNDFGANAWGSYGIHDPGTYAQIESDFAALSAAGVRLVRWFVFADARAGVTFDMAGTPTGVDAYLFADLDALLSIAEQHGIRLDLVLFDFTLMQEPTVDRGVQIGGHAAVINTLAGQRALLSRVLEPVFERYRSRQTVLSWEVMNEPDWVVTGVGKLDAHVPEPASLPSFRGFVAQVATAVHEQSNSLVTLGAASATSLHNWRDLGLDYYDVHYYDWMSRSPWTDLFDTTAGELNLDRPVIVGEFPADGSRIAGLPGFLDTWIGDGYAGAWPWSYRGVDSSGRTDLQALAAWVASHPASSCASAQ